MSCIDCFSYFLLPSLGARFTTAIILRRPGRGKQSDNAVGGEHLAHLLALA